MSIILANHQHNSYCHSQQLLAQTFLEAVPFYFSIIMGIGKYNKVGPKQDVCLAACEDQVSFLQLTTEAEFMNVQFR
jgi:hypothetical protein